MVRSHPSPVASRKVAPHSSPVAVDPLPIRHVEFLGGMAEPGGWRPPSALPEIAFAGRSNVGKSSLLNRLVRRKSLARVSATPGRTRAINFFGVNDAFVLADLPGYGYARVSKETRATWRPLLDAYLGESPALRGVVLLVDARREASAEDVALRDAAAERGVPVLVALTKCDTLSDARAGEREGALAATLEVDPDQVVRTSARTGAGRDDLAAAIVALLSAPPLGAG